MAKFPSDPPIKHKNTSVLVESTSAGPGIAAALRPCKTEECGGDVKNCKGGPLAINSYGGSHLLCCIQFLHGKNHTPNGARTRMTTRLTPVLFLSHRHLLSSSVPFSHTQRHFSFASGIPWMFLGFNANTWFFIASSDCLPHSDDLVATPAAFLCSASESHCSK